MTKIEDLRRALFGKPRGKALKARPVKAV